MVNKIRFLSLLFHHVWNRFGGKDVDTYCYTFSNKLDTSNDGGFTNRTSENRKQGFQLIAIKRILKIGYRVQY